MRTYEKYKFKIGALHDRKKVDNVDEYIEIAKKTHEYLETLRIDDKDGIYWALEGKENGDGAVYTGSAGVIYLYIELYKYFF